jgi:hypothetical protein
MITFLTTAQIAILSIIVSVVGTWATMRFKLGSHDKMLEEGNKKFIKLFDKIADDVVKNIDLTNAKIQIDKNLNDKTKNLSDMCNEKHTSCNTNITQLFNDRTEILNKNFERLNSLVELKITDSTKCMNEVKQSIIKLTSDFQNFKEITNDRLNARDRSFIDMHKQLNSIERKMIEVPTSIKESLVMAMNEVVKELKVNDKK